MSNLLNLSIYQVACYCDMSYFSAGAVQHCVIQETEKYCCVRLFTFIYFGEKQSFIILQPIFDFNESERTSTFLIYFAH